MSDLLPCPFCGHDNPLADECMAAIICMNEKCSAEMNTGGSIEAAKAEWNIRAKPAGMICFPLLPYIEGPVADAADRKANEAWEKLPRKPVMRQPSPAVGQLSYDQMKAQWDFAEAEIDACDALLIKAGAPASDGYTTTTPSQKLEWLLAGQPLAVEVTDAMIRAFRNAKARWPNCISFSDTDAGIRAGLIDALLETKK